LKRRGDALKVACITVLGSGFAPLASGTWGSLFSIFLYVPIWFAAGLTPWPRVVGTGLTVAGIVLASWLSVRWGGWAIARFGRSDPKQFVLDEFAGQWVALLLLPLAAHTDLWSWLCLVGGQFFLFRAFDVVKPPPARQAERLPAGWGILTDDLFAGAYANIVGQLIWRLTPAAIWLGARLSEP
jgi:phosphatidylglycerophosphatase A